jgi:hypothetical protein
MDNRVGVVRAVLWEDTSQLYLAERQSESVAISGSGLGWSAVDGESPVRENPAPALYQFPSSSEPVEFAVNLPGPPGKPKYFSMTDSGLVP